MKVSLIVSTYNSPDALRVTLDSVMAQTRLPDEVVVADDGSADPTHAVVAEFQRKAPFPIIYVWQPDEGFRLAMIRNKAIAQASGNFIIQIDGDILLHPSFVADHIGNARRGFISCGKRVLLGKSLTDKLMQTKGKYPSVFSRDMRNRKNAIRSPLLGAFFKMLGGKKVRHRGCNMAYWRKDAIAVNGFDEAYEGWGLEDTDFYERLLKSGVKPQQIANQAIAFHLWHPSNESANESLSKNRELLSNARNSFTFRASDGIDKYLNQ